MGSEYYARLGRIRFHGGEGEGRCLKGGKVAPVQFSKVNRHLSRRDLAMLRQGILIAQGICTNHYNGKCVEANINFTN